MTGEEALNLGIMYFKGELVEKNLDKALEYFQEARDLNNKSAYRWLAKYYWDNISDSSHDKLIFLYLKKALESDSQDAEVLLLLALCYENGYGVEIDYQKYIDLILRSAELGEEETFPLLCLHYSNGYFDYCGIKKDLEKALYWAERSKRKDLIEAMKRRIQKNKELVDE